MLLAWPVDGPGARTLYGVGDSASFETLESSVRAEVVLVTDFDSWMVWLSDGVMKIGDFRINIEVTTTVTSTIAVSEFSFGSSFACAAPLKVV
jgi:hypothetical protein